MRESLSPKRLLWILFTTFALAGIVVACTDRPTGPDRIAHRGIPQFNDPCPPEGCQLEGIVVTACPPGYIGEYPDCTPENPDPNPDPCTTDPNGPGCGGDDPCLTDPYAPGCPGGGGGGGTTEPPPSPDGSDGATDESCIDGSCYECPLWFSGKTVTALISVADGGSLGTNNHEFKFTGKMYRIGDRSNPSWYSINPTASTDNWWYAESGKILVNCSKGSIVFGRWTGMVSWAGDADVHLVMGPSHPYFPK